MAQLRDAKTSELIAEGDPIDLVVLANSIGRDEVVFDGVDGSPAELPQDSLQVVRASDFEPKFNPDAVLESHQERLAGLQGALEDSDNQKDQDLVRGLQKAVAEVQGKLEPVPDAVDKAVDALGKARAGLE